MKITRITPIMADGGHRIIVFVKVETDQPGLIGWGEATLEGKPRAIAGCIQDMEPMILGQDPRRIEHCWQILYRSGFWRMGVIGLSAISGIDQALWDIKGKDLGVPVYELLGGRVRDKVRVYTHFTGPSATGRAICCELRRVRRQRALQGRARLDGDQDRAGADHEHAGRTEEAQARRGVPQDHSRSGGRRRSTSCSTCTDA